MKPSYISLFLAAEREMREANRCAGTMWAAMHQALAEMYLEMADQHMERVRKRHDGFYWQWVPPAIRKALGT